jgi:hypothetical protein
MTARTQEHDSMDSTFGTGKPLKDNLDRIAGGHVSLDRTASTGQTEQVSLDS